MVSSSTTQNHQMFSAMVQTHQQQQMMDLRLSGIDQRQSPVSELQKYRSCSTDGSPETRPDGSTRRSHHSQDTPPLVGVLSGGIIPMDHLSTPQHYQMSSVQILTQSQQQISAPVSALRTDGSVRGSQLSQDTPPSVGVITGGVNPMASSSTPKTHQIFPAQSQKQCMDLSPSGPISSPVFSTIC